MVVVVVEGLRVVGPMKVVVVVVVVVANSLVARKRLRLKGAFQEDW